MNLKKSCSPCVFCDCFVCFVSSWWHQTHTCIDSFSLDKIVDMFSMQFESLRVHVPDCAIHLKRSHVHRSNINNTLNCPFVQISALDIVLVGFIYTNELKYKVLKCYVVVKLLRHEVQTNRVSVALWRSLKWLLLRAKYSYAIFNENEIECRRNFLKHAM